MGKKAIKLAIFNLTENSRKKESMKKVRKKMVFYLKR
jgi:hypothetical protein